MRLLWLILLFLVARPARADHPFEQGRVRLAVVLGNTSAFQSNYIVGGGGVGYFVLDGLELGVDAQFWFGGKPSISTVQPQVRYVLHFVPTLKPYVGGFYRHWFISRGFADFDAAGGRAGAFYVSEGGRWYIGLGVVYEKIVNRCSGDCELMYPEIFVSISL